MSHLPEFDLSGRTAIVTGGNGGAGKGIALGLARAGANVVIAARDEAKTAAALPEFTAVGVPGDRVAPLRCDITTDGDAKRAVDFAVERFGGLAILVNNAANFSEQRESFDVDAWDTMLRTNVRAPFLLARAARKWMAAGGGGKIINISSGAATIAFPNMPGYAASKAGIDSLTRSLALSFAPSNIQVNCIQLGSFDTPGSPVTEEGARAWSAMTPARRVGDIHELAGIAIFLASRASDYMTGQCFAFDGGVTLPALGPK